MAYKTLTTIGLALFGIGLSATVSAGEYYRWIDEHGVSHFSQQPPPVKEVQAEKLKVNSRTPSAEEASAAEQAVEKELEPTKKISTYDPKRCNVERQRLKTLQSGSRIRMPDGKGGFRYLEQDQINLEMQKSQRAVSESCTQ